MSSGTAIRVAIGRVKGWSSTAPISPPNTNFRGSAENLHLVERYTRVDSETIAYEVTVDDPTTVTRDWTVVVSLKSPDPIFEYACHEGNISLAGMLKGARAQEAAETESK